MLKNERDHYICKMAKKCRYGAPMDSGYFYGCDYIGMTGKSRTAQGKKGEIIDGKCELFEDIKNARTKARAKNRYDNATKRRYEP